MAWSIQEKISCNHRRHARLVNHDKNVCAILRPARARNTEQGGKRTAEQPSDRWHQYLALARTQPPMSALIGKGPFEMESVSAIVSLQLFPTSTTKIVPEVDLGWHSSR
jgi:hypothetical protein